MKKYTQKFISLAAAALFLFTLLPAAVFASEADSSSSSAPSQSSSASQQESSSSSADSLADSSASQEDSSSSQQSSTPDADTSGSSGDAGSSDASSGDAGSSDASGSDAGGSDASGSDAGGSDASGEDKPTARLAPFGISGIMPLNLGVSLGNFDAANVVNITSGTLTRNNGAPIGNKGDVSAAEILMLAYNFNFDTAVNSVREGNIYTIQLPTGIKWAAKEGPLDLKATMQLPDNTTEEVVFAQLEVDEEIPSGPLVAKIKFTGSFWTSPNSYTQLQTGYLQIGCQLDMDAIGLNHEYTINVHGGSSFPIKASQNAPKDHQLLKTGTYKNDRFHWEVEYVPGTKNGNDLITADADIPVKLVDSWETAKMVFVNTPSPGVQVFLKDASGTWQPSTNPAPTVATGTSGANTTLTIVLNAADAKVGVPIKITYQTTLADDELLPGATGAPNNTSTTVTNSVDLIHPTAGTPLFTKSDTVTVTKDLKSFIAKTGQKSANKPNNILWNIKVTTRDRKLENLYVYDILRDGLVLDTSIPVQVKIDGATAVPFDPTYGTLNIAPGTINGKTPTFMLKCNAALLAAGTTFEFLYETTAPLTNFEDGSSVSKTFNNEAFLNYDWKHRDGTPGNITFTLPEISKGHNVDLRAIAKTAVKYLPDTHEMEWVITVNPYSVTTGNGVTGKVIDDFTSDAGGKNLVDGVNPFKHSLVAGSVVISNTTNITSVAQDAKYLEFDVTNLTSAATIKYKTRLDNDAKDLWGMNHAGKTFYNRARLTGTIAGNPVGANMYVDAGVKITSTVLAKTGAYDPATGLATWTVVINQNEMDMQNVRVVDTVDAYQQFVPGSATINGAPATAAIAGQTLTVTVGNIAASDANPEKTIKYQTRITPDKLDDFKQKTTATLKNSVQLLRNDFGPEQTNAAITVQNKLMDKTGTYNGTRRVIDFAINLNPHKLEMGGVVLKDELPNGVALDVTTLKLYEATVAHKSGTTPDVYTKGAQIGDAGNLGFCVESNSNAFSVTLPAGKRAYVLEYTVDITDYTKSPFVNNAYLDNVSFTGPAGSCGDSVSAWAGGGGTGILNSKAALTLQKQCAETGAPLAGVEFGLYTKIGGKEICTMQGLTGADGKLQFMPLNLNQTYTLKEITPLRGYHTPQVVTAGGKTALKDYTFTATAAGNVNITVTNQRTRGNVSFLNVSTKGHVLPNMKFTLQHSSDDSITHTATSDHTGLVNFAGVLPGTYHLTADEQDVDGHTLNTTKYVVTVLHDGSVSIVHAETGETLADGALAHQHLEDLGTNPDNSTPPGGKGTVTNTTFTSPQTGDDGNLGLWAALAAAAVLLLGATAFAYSPVRKADKQNRANRSR